MSRFLLDTNVLSEVLKKRPAKSVLDRIDEHEDDGLSISAVTVMELRYGAVRHPNGTRLWARITEELLPRVEILPIDEQVGQRAGDILADLASRGLPIGTEDVLIAATALQHDLTVATRNLQHFERISDLSAESWWS
jgi:predicted nucleic acid-binding protein